MHLSVDFSHLYNGLGEINDDDNDDDDGSAGKSIVSMPDEFEDNVAPSF